MMDVLHGHYMYEYCCVSESAIEAPEISIINRVITACGTVSIMSTVYFTILAPLELVAALEGCCTIP
jgi:precorrin isomerase